MSRHLPKKRFGQNFLQDSSIINAIVEAVRPQPDDCMAEIGPGLLALTRPLAQHLRQLHVVEIDRDIVTRLESSDLRDKLVIHHTDALAFDFGSLCRPLRLVGNLPYNISTPLLFHLLTFADGITDMHFMLQKEVVERMVAGPGNTDYGRLSVMLQYRCDLHWILDVPPEAFYPPPKVDSAVVRLVPKPADRPRARDEAVFRQVVAQAFAQRRKTIRNNLKGVLDDAGFAALDLDPGLRAEALSLMDYIRLADYLSAPA